MDSTEQSVDGQQTKRRRRTGWDAPAAPGQTLPSAPVSVAPPLDTLAAQRLAFEKAQALVAQQVLAQSIGRANNFAIPIPMAPAFPTIASTNPLIPGIINAIPSIPTMSIASGLQLPAGMGASTLDCRIYVGSMHYTVSENDARALFSPFGIITKIDMSFDAVTNRSKGYCFIEFSDPNSATAAMEMNQFELGGRKIKVGRPAGFSGGSASTSSVLATAASGGIGSDPKLQIQALLAQAFGKDSDNTNEGGGSVSSAEANNNSNAPPPPPPSKSICVKNVRSEISATELQTIFSPFGNIAFSGYFGTPSPQPSGVITLSVLLIFASATSATEATVRMHGFSLAGQILEVTSVPDKEAAKIKSDILAAEKKPKLHKVVLENMVSIEEVTDPTLKGEIAEEARRYGELRDVNIVIDHTKAVKVFLEYTHAAEAEKAFKTFDKRYFGGRCLSAKLIE